ncbi:uncharacterized protein BJ171DRAFT_501610 [Polychytrium aggregatum]|uniref:uncharacterized protein n=1 Tax=Polychytrium aggregatum TaxID=110093 RepID=UPI0022FEBC1F|nr:uncharacterized protein BJ171DRAFT_501610 [Polychytrium aggregatum]KAI9205270.1 hypothetical protein BJ171DRAFT_501610 [Polychytrium aggregatum]
MSQSTPSSTPVSTPVSIPASSHQCLAAKAWETAPNVFRQIDGIGPQFSKSLGRGGINSLADLARCDPRKIEMLVGRNPPFGNKILDVLSSFPRLTIAAAKVETFAKAGGSKDAELWVTITLVSPSDGRVCKRFRKALFLAFVGSTYLHHRSIGLPKLAEEPIQFKFSIGSPKGAVEMLILHDEHGGRTTPDDRRPTLWQPAPSSLLLCPLIALLSVVCSWA